MLSINFSEICQRQIGIILEISFSELNPIASVTRLKFRLNFQTAAVSDLLGPHEHRIPNARR